MGSASNANAKLRYVFPSGYEVKSVRRSRLPTTSAC